MQKQAQHERKAEQNEQRVGQLVREVATADLRELGREVRACLASKDHEGETTVRGERSERDGERRQVEHADEQAVDEAQ